MNPHLSFFLQFFKRTSTSSPSSVLSPTQHAAAPSSPSARDDDDEDATVGKRFQEIIDSLYNGDHDDDVNEPRDDD